MNFDFDMNLYKTFYTVAKNGSFSKAANELCVSQPSISYSIKQLEERLDTKLFNRTSKGIKITPEAQQLLTYVENSYNIISIGEKALKESKDLLHGKVSIGVQSHIGEFFLFPYVQQFNKKYPQIEINIISRNTAEMLKFLQNNDIDFMIDTSPVEPLYNNLEILPLFDLENCFITKNKKTELEACVQIKELEKYPLILPVKRSSPRKQLEKCCKDLGVKLNPFMTIETTEMMIDAVKDNMGIGYVIKQAVKNELERQELYQIEIKEKLPTLELNLVYIDEYLTYVPKMFIEMIKKDYISKK